MDAHDEAAAGRQEVRRAPLVLVLGVGCVVGLTTVAGLWSAPSVVAVAAVLATVVAAVAVRSRAAGDRPSVPWHLVVVGLALHAVGAVLAAVLAAVHPGGEALPVPSAADVLAALGLACIGLGMVHMAALRTRGVDRVARTDAVIAAVGTATTAAVLLVAPVQDADLDPAANAAAGGALLLAVGLAAASARFGAGRPGDTAAGRLLATGAVVLLVGLGLGWWGRLVPSPDVLAALGHAVVVLGLGCVAAATVHPSARTLTDPRLQPVHGLTQPRLALLALTAVAAPVAAVGSHAAGRPVDVVVVGLGGAVLVVLVLVRLQVVVAAAREAARREVVLRQAAGAISTATGAAEVRVVVLDSAARLLGEDLRFVCVATVNDRQAVVAEVARGRMGALDPMEDGILAVLAAVPVEPAGPVRRVVRDAEVVVVPFASRLGPRTFLVAVGAPTVPDDQDEVLAILCTQAGFAVDGVVHAAAVQAERTEARFRELVRHSSDAIVILDDERRVRYQTPSVVRVLGYLTVDLDGTSLDRLVPQAHRPLFDSFLDQLLASPPETVRTLDLQLVRADESVVHTEVVGANLLQLAEVGGVVLTIRDVSGRRTLEDQLRHQAFHDSLTGLANRALFLDRVEHALDRTRRERSVSPAVAYIDLDDFKTVNDSLGHGAGDELLKVIADRVRRSLRPGDTPARLGGDEFAILLEDAADVGAVIEVAERILEALHEPVRIGGTEVYVRASIGVAVRKGPDSSTDELLRNADLAMYAAKAAGKGRIEVFEPDMHRRAVERLSVISELERSLASGDIGLAYQPIVSLRTREVVGFEALARWSHPDRGPVSPVEFVPIAEETGLILPLGRLVLEQACQQVARWRAMAPEREWRLSVNLSARQLFGPDLVAVAQEALDRAGLDPAALTLELTESVLLSDSERVLMRLHALKDLGVQVALDDFGTGYSSLSYLERVPFDVIKIDRAFVSALRTDEPESTLANTIIDLARTLGRTTIAEGIEHEAELAGLLALGCELGQGHLFSPAVDIAAIEAFLGLDARPDPALSLPAAPGREVGAPSGAAVTRLALS